MDKITQLLQDPSWWFSAFIVAVIASIVGALLREYVPKWLSGVSARFRRVAERREAERTEQAESLSKRPIAVIIQAIRGYAYLIVVALLLVGIQVGITAVATKALMKGEKEIHWAFGVYMLFGMVGSIWIMLRAFSILGTARRALALIYKDGPENRSLPMESPVKQRVPVTSEPETIALLTVLHKVAGTQGMTEAELRVGFGMDPFKAHDALMMLVERGFVEVVSPPGQTGRYALSPMGREQSQKWLGLVKRDGSEPPLIRP